MTKSLKNTEASKNTLVSIKSDVRKTMTSILNKAVNLEYDGQHYNAMLVYLHYKYINEHLDVARLWQDDSVIHAMYAKIILAIKLLNYIEFGSGRNSLKSTDEIVDMVFDNALFLNRTEPITYAKYADSVRNATYTAIVDTCRFLLLNSY